MKKCFLLLVLCCSIIPFRGDRRGYKFYHNERILNVVRESPGVLNWSRTQWICMVLGICSIIPQPAQADTPNFKTIYQWNQLEFDYESLYQRQIDIDSGVFTPGVIAPIDVDVYYALKQRNQVFVTIPKFVEGIPATLGTVTNRTYEGNPLIKPYPDWQWHRNPEGCHTDRIVSVFRVKIDECGRLWVLDTGKVGEKVICRPQILCFDLSTKQILHRHLLPNDVVSNHYLLVTPEVDVRDPNSGCRDTFVYIADVLGFSLLVYDVAHDKSWRIQDKTFYPYPSHGTYTIAGESFDLMDGLLGLALSPHYPGQDRILFYHAMSSPTENWVYTSHLRNSSIFEHDAAAAPQIFNTFANQRSTQTAAEAIDKDGVMLFGLMKDTQIMCWNTRTEYGRKNFDVVAVNPETLQFPSGVKIIRNKKGEQELWILTSRFQKVANGSLNPKEPNFRILAGKVEDILYGTKCRSKQTHHNQVTGSFGGGYGLYPFENAVQIERHENSEMAVDNWFQNWHQPFVSIPYSHPLNYTRNHEDYSHDKSLSPVRLLPVLMSLNVLKPERKSSRNKHQYSNTFFKVEPDLKEPYRHYQDNEESSGDRKYHPNPLGFPDPFHRRADDDQKNQTYEEEHYLRPLEVTGPFKTWYRWKTIDFAYPSSWDRARAIVKGDYIEENNLPLGIEVYKNRVFISLPKWKKGVPVTLAQLPRVPKEESPALIPFPNWDWHSEKNCDLMTSVFRMQVDTCGRLWVLDSGKISITTEEATQHCPPKLLIFDLETDQLIEKYIFRKEFILQDGLYSNIIIDIREDNCADAYAYMSDVWRFGIVVYRLFDGKAWRITDHLFYPDPLAARYKLHHLEFYWMDGIFGMALSPAGHAYEDRMLYFHSMSGYREFYVKASYLREEKSKSDGNAFKVLGQSRGDQGHISSSVMDDNGIMYFNLVTRDSMGCWDSRKPYKRANLGIIAQSRDTLVFPNDLRLDQEKKQSMWVLTNRLPYYLMEGLEASIYNFRVMSAYTDDSIRGGICDPAIQNSDTFVEPLNDIHCD
ncbi:hypothetical protein YQE_12764, partial [Dendroctonus ponderosae]